MGPWEFHPFRNGLHNVVYDRLGHHLCSHIRYGDGPLMAAAPAMRDLLVDLLAGADVDHISARASLLLAEIQAGRPRQPGEDDE